MDPAEILQIRVPRKSSQNRTSGERFVALTGSKIFLTAFSNV